jgi:hypothetical protein
MGGIVAVKFAVDHPDRMLTGTLVGMGLLQQGGAMQQSHSGRASDSPTKQLRRKKGLPKPASIVRRILDDWD